MVMIMNYYFYSTRIVKSELDILEGLPFIEVRLKDRYLKTIITCTYVHLSIYFPELQFF